MNYCSIVEVADIYLDYIYYFMVEIVLIYFYFYFFNLLNYFLT